MGRLDGKVAIITGGAGGMGAKHAELFVEEGAKVVIADLGQSNGKKLAEELGENTLFVELDVTKKESWENVIKETEDKFGPVNILINNAGITIPGSIEETSYEDYLKTVEINQHGTYLGMKTVVNSMKKGNSGSIVNISSTAGLVGVDGQGPYTATKFAVRGLAKAGAVEFAKYNIRVNSVHPGLIRTPMTEREDIKEGIKELTKGVPLQRVAEPEEVSNLVLYLASDESSYSTGTEFVVDGGATNQLT